MMVARRSRCSRTNLAKYSRLHLRAHACMQRHGHHTLKQWLRHAALERASAAGKECALCKNKSNLCRDSQLRLLAIADGTP